MPDLRRSSFLIFTKMNWLPSHGCMDDGRRGARYPCPITRKQIGSADPDIIVSRTGAKRISLHFSSLIWKSMTFRPELFSGTKLGYSQCASKYPRTAISLSVPFKSWPTAGEAMDATIRHKPSVMELIIEEGWQQIPMSAIGKLCRMISNRATSAFANHVPKS